MESLQKELREHAVLFKESVYSFAVYYAHTNQIPHLMNEIGRERQKAFSVESGDIKKDGEEEYHSDLIDIDAYDKYAIQIILWDPRNARVAGGYRYFILNETPRDHEGFPKTPMFHLFNMSEHFLKEYMPLTIELGRAFVSIDYQKTRAFHALLVGLSALTLEYKNKYFLGKVTMYPTYNQQARNLILAFLEKHYKGEKSLISPKEEFAMSEVDRPIQELVSLFKDTSKDVDFAVLGALLKEIDASEVKIAVPVLIRFYRGLSSKMRAFHIARNPECRNQEEIPFLIKISDIDISKIEMYISFYKHGLGGVFMQLQELRSKMAKQKKRVSKYFKRSH